jgi:hypothetical protein
MRLSEIGSALWFWLEEKILAAAVDVLVDSGVFDSLGADGAINHIRR